MLHRVSEPINDNGLLQGLARKHKITRRTDGQRRPTAKNGARAESDVGLHGAGLGQGVRRTAWAPMHAIQTRVAAAPSCLLSAERTGAGTVASC